MIKKEDVLNAIAECQGQRNPNANTCIKLASLYTILDHTDSEEPPLVDPPTGYSYASKPVSNTIEYDGDSDFAQAIMGQDSDKIWKIMDELMTTLEIINPRLYDGVMNKIY